MDPTSYPQDPAAQMMAYQQHMAYQHAAYQHHMYHQQMMAYHQHYQAAASMGAAADPYAAHYAGVPPDPRYAAHHPDPAEIERRRQEDEQRRRQEDEARRAREDAQRKAEEDKASRNITAMITKLKTATPENIEALRKELKQVMDRELHRAPVGAKSKLTADKDQALKAAEQAVAATLQSRKLLAEKQKEKERLTQSIVKDLTRLVTVAEEKLRLLTEAAAPLESPDISDAMAIDAGQAVEKHAPGAESSAKACSEFLLEKSADIRSIGPGIPVVKLKIPGQPDAAPDSGEALAKLLRRAQELNNTTNMTLAKARQAAGKVNRKKVAKAMFDKIAALFKKYDADKDGFLNRKEAAKYAKSELGFTASEEFLDTFWLKHLQDKQAKGVGPDRFQRLKVAIGIQRDFARDLIRQKDRAEKEKVLATLRVKWQEKVGDAMDLLLAADEVVGKAEIAVIGINGKLGSGSSSKAEVDESLDELQKLASEGRSSMGSVTEVMKGLADGVFATMKADFEEWLVENAKQLNLKLTLMGPRLDRLDGLVVRLRDQAKALPDAK